jgi:hypothetical protein
VQQAYINHVGLVLDASASMGHLRSETVQVVDNQISYLAQRSEELDQETRVTVYTFNTKVTPVFYDMDALRARRQIDVLRNAYHPDSQTALIDATMKAISDLEQTATLYGDHAFLIYVLTDGQENASAARPSALTGKISWLPDNWTLAVLVPDQRGVFEAKKFGFLPGNISVWKTTSEGITEVGETIRRATDSYMQARSTGVRSTSGLFSMHVDNLTRAAVNATLKKLDPNDFFIFPVHQDMPINEFVVSRTGQAYRIGSAYYELTKTETIQASKQICVCNNRTGDVHSGQAARQLLGLPDYEVKVKPADHPDYSIFVQSTSTNRKLLRGTSLLVLA